MEKVKMPNIESLVSGFVNNNTSLSAGKEDNVEIIGTLNEGEPERPLNNHSSESLLVSSDNQLWEALLKCLEERREKPADGQKTYFLDADIIETLNQCDFKVSTTQVVNSILRIFLMHHLPQLMQIRKVRPATLFDKYESKPHKPYAHENDQRNRREDN